MGVLTVAGILTSCGGDDTAAPQPTPTPTQTQGLSSECQAAVDETLVEIGATLDAVAAGDVEQGDPLPELGASLLDACSADEVPGMWGELIVGTWIDVEEGDLVDLQVTARVTLVLEMCERAAGYGLRAAAQIACGFAAVLTVEPWYAPLTDE